MELERKSSKLLNKKYVNIYDFIEKYKDSDNEDIKLLINGIIDDYLNSIESIMTTFITYFSLFFEDYPIIFGNHYEYNRISLLLDDIRSELSVVYDLSKEKEDLWKYIDFDLNYIWEKALSECKPTEKLPPLKFILENGEYFLDKLKKGENKCND